MSLVGPWLVFPLVLALLCAGTGLLVERLGGRRLPTPLLLPLGFCGLVATLMLVTTVTPLAPASPWVALALGLAGLATGWRRLRATPLDRWAVGLPLVVYGLFAATAVLTWQRTFLGYTSLGDASFNFMLAERVVEHGRSLDGLAPSTYQQVLANYLITAYPLGSHVVLGATAKLALTDVAWAYQPYLAALAALFSLALLPLARELLGRRGAALAAAVTAGGGMIFAYATLQQAIKELATVVVLTALVALVGPLVRERPGPRVGLPLVVAAAAGLGVLSVALAPWAGPVLLVALVAVAARWWRVARGAVVAEVAVFAAVGAVLAIPTLLLLSTFLAVSDSSLTTGTAQGALELGNLARQVPFGNVFGAWPAGDYRLGLSPTGSAAVALAGTAAALAVAGAVTVVRRRAFGVTLFAAVSLLGFLLVVGRASPWAYGKALMILSPAFVLLAAIAVGTLWRSRRVETVLLGVALLGGVVWTDALAYHNADPAPQDRLGELDRIGERFAGQGPATTFEFEEYGKYFLRALEPNALTEGVNRGDVALAPGRTVQFGVSSEPDDWNAAELAQYRLLVVRRGPVQSRPPSNFDRVFRGRYYSVWRRDDAKPVPLVHQALGSRFGAAARPRCRDVAALARQAAAAGGRLAVAPRPVVGALNVTGIEPYPANWGRDGTDAAVLRPLGPGRVTGDVSVGRAGTYHVWAEGSFGRRATVTVDGRRVGTAGPALSPRLGAETVGTVPLAAGAHRVAVTLGGGDLRPGNGGTNRFVGPVYLTPAADVDAVPVRTLAPSAYRQACDRGLDWIEVLPG